MLIQDIIQILKDFGFPVFVALYLMLYNSKITKDNTEATNKMRESLDKLIDTLREHSSGRYGSSTKKYERN